MLACAQAALQRRGTHLFAPEPRTTQSCSHLWYELTDTPLVHTPNVRKRIISNHPHIFWCNLRRVVFSRPLYQILQQSIRILICRRFGFAKCMRIHFKSIGHTLMLDDRHVPYTQLQALCGMRPVLVEQQRNRYPTVNRHARSKWASTYVPEFLRL